jgi:hypothetical protein
VQFELRLPLAFGLLASFTRRGQQCRHGKTQWTEKDTADNSEERRISFVSRKITTSETESHPNQNLNGEHTDPPWK